MNLSKNVKIVKLVSGTTEVDPTNYDGVLFLGNGTKLEVADEKGDVAEVTKGTASVLYVDIYRPIEGRQVDGHSYQRIRRRSVRRIVSRAR